MATESAENSERRKGGFDQLGGDLFDLGQIGTGFDGEKG